MPIAESNNKGTIMENAEIIETLKKSGKAPLEFCAISLRNNELLNKKRGSATHDNNIKQMKSETFR